MATEVKITRANISTISISGDMEQARAKFVSVKQVSQRYGGNILREQEFSDGFFLEVHFADENLMRVYENNIGIK